MGATARPRPGVLLPGQPTCLAHLDEADRAAHLAALSPGDDIDLRGTPFTRVLPDELFRALTDPATGLHRFGALLLEGARFDGDLLFDGAVGLMAVFAARRLGAERIIAMPATPSGRGRPASTARPTSSPSAGTRARPGSGS